MSLALAYLARGTGAGLPSAKAFLQSYRAKPPGCDHQLYVLAKGWDDPDEITKLQSLAEEVNADFLELPDDGFDWGAYLRFTAQATQKRVCFLNSHSRIERENWLEILTRHAAAPGVGAAGCTGSWGTLRPVWSWIGPLARNRQEHEGRRRGLSLRLRCTLAFSPQWLLRCARFPAFPNPHLRSNAFVIHTELLRRFMETRPFPASKPDVHRLESGYRSLTRFLRSENLSVVVSGADGIAYPPQQWIESRTFRTPDQSNLLVSDNQTRGYLKAPPQMKRIMELSAWGRFFTPPGRHG